MERIVKFLTCLILASPALVMSCDKYDDSAIQSRIAAVENRVSNIELLCSQTNINIMSIQSTIHALQNNDCVVGVDSIKQENKVIGYVIKFKTSPSITVYNGKNGLDGHSPAVGVKQYTDGLYYWTLDGEWILDVGGRKMKVAGVDGKDGVNGITPQLKIVDGNWNMSVDNGVSWSVLGKATGEDDKDRNLLEIKVKDGFVLLRLSDGTVLRLRIENLDTFLMDTPMPNEIFYRTTDRKIASVKETYVFNECGFNVASNVYDSEKDLGILTFDRNLEVVPNSLFSRTVVSYVMLPEGMTSIGGYAFNGCSSLTSVPIPEGVTSIGRYAFNGCSSLTSVPIPKGVTSIENSIFNGCSSLTSISIPEGVTSIGQKAFNNCSNLTSISINCIIPPTMYGYAIYHTCIIKVPAQSVDAYKNDERWRIYEIKAI